MMTTNVRGKDKTNPFLLSEQVKNILQSQGFGRVFNYQDYEYFKRKAKKAFNKAHSIADLFIQDHGQDESEFNEYIF